MADSSPSSVDATAQKVAHVQLATPAAAAAASGGGDGMPQPAAEPQQAAGAAGGDGSAAAGSALLPTKIAFSCRDVYDMMQKLDQESEKRGQQNPCFQYDINCGGQVFPVRFP